MAAQDRWKHYNFMLMKTQVQAAALLLLISSVSSTFTVVNTTFNYDYPTTTLLNVTDIYNQSFPIDLGFSVYIEGTLYDRLYVSSNSSIYFGNPSKAPIIYINDFENFALNIIVSATPDNVTVYYRGRRQNLSLNGEMAWKCTIFKSPYFWKFGIDIISNTFSNYYEGVGQICPATADCQQIDTVSARGSMCWGCESFHIPNNFRWNGSECAVVCSRYYFTQGVPLSWNSCQCIEPYYWSGLADGCLVNCSNISHTISNISGKYSCVC